MLFRSLLPRIYRPEVYQGPLRASAYFEGWYLKLVDASGRQIWSFIAGVSFGEEHHSFIQVIHANSGQTWYKRFPLENFHSSRRTFRTEIGPNHFSLEGLSVDLALSGLNVKGELVFKNTSPFPSSFRSPGIMGWYAYAPRMECYHGVVSMQHSLAGSLEVNGDSLNFEGGKGYIEKDWGRSMPSDWIWVQSNHFESDAGASFMLSMARIPWMKGFFPGFLSFLLLDGKLYRFATYNHSSVRVIEVETEYVHIVIQNRGHTLDLLIHRNIGGMLKAPRHGNMDREIQESVVSRLDLELKDSTGKVIFSDQGIHAGLEIVGDVAQYFKNYN